MEQYTIFLIEMIHRSRDIFACFGIDGEQFSRTKYVNTSNMTYIYLWLHRKQGSLALHKTITADIIIDIIKWGFYGRKMFDRLERKTH